MKNAFYFPVQHNASFGERITALRENKGIRSIQLLAEDIFYTLNKYNKTGIEETDNGTIESIRKRISSHLKQDCNPKMEFIKEYCDYFECESDFLLGYIDFPTRQAQDVYKITGLNEKAVDALKMIQIQDKNENSITVFPKNLFNKMMNHTDLSEEELKQIENIFFDTTDEHIRFLDSHRPLLMDILNYMLASGYMEELVKYFRNFINAKYKVPVYFDNEKKCFVYPDNEYSYTGDFTHGNTTFKGNYVLNFASSQDNPNDNAPIFITDTFFDTVTLKDVEKLFYEMRTDFEKGSD